MAITDNAFTAAEIQATVTANPALLAELKAGLTPLGHHAISKDEHAAFVETERGIIAASKTKEIYDKLDADVLATSGVAKATAEEKTYDYVKRVLGTSKTAAEKLTGEIATLKDTIAKGDGDAAVKAQLAATQAKLAKLEGEELPKYQQQLFAKDVNMDLELGLRNIKLRKDLPASLLTAPIANIKAGLIERAKKDAAGNVYYVDASGNLILDGVKPASAEYVLKLMPEMADLIEKEGAPGKGAQSQPPAGPLVPTEVKNKDGKIIEMPSDGVIKSLEELHAYLAAQGLTDDDPNFIKLFKEHGQDKKLPLRKVG